MDPKQAANKILAELGRQNPDPALVEKLENHFAVVIMEVVLRRAPEAKLREIKKKLEADDPGLELLIADISSGIPGLAQEIEEALNREFNALRGSARARGSS